MIAPIGIHNRLRAVYLILVTGTLIGLLHLRMTIYGLANLEHFESQSSLSKIYSSWMNSSFSRDSSYNEATSQDVAQATVSSFWPDFATILEDSKPDVEPLHWSKGPKGDEPFMRFYREIGEDYDYRPDLLTLDAREFGEMKNTYDHFIERTRNLSSMPSGQPGTRGIATTSKDLVILVVTIRMLRRIGSKLPVEVFVKSREDYEPDICEGVLPDLNAKCIIMDELMDQHPLQVESFALKLFAVLFSSFEHVLLLDSDNFPVVRPDDLLLSEPYLSHGLVTWPDYWVTTTSHYWYDMIGLPTPDVRLRATTESGQVLLNKKTHLLDLLLMVYLNFYGTDYFYPLLSQGGFGIGDKDTFVAAAEAMNSTFYQVVGGPDLMGFMNQDGGHVGAGIRQHDPRTDQLAQQLLQEPQSVVSENRTLIPKIENQPAFMHSQTFKFNPTTFPAKWSNEIKTRVWGPTNIARDNFNGRDLEVEVYTEMMLAACQLEAEFESWKEWRDGNGDNICQSVRAVYDQMFNQTSWR